MLSIHLPSYISVLVNNALTWKSSCVIANNAEKQQKLFVQGYNFTVIISGGSWFYLCDIISRSRNRLSSLSKVRFTPC